MDLEAINVKLSYPLILGGVAVFAIGFFWLIVRLFRRGQPFFRRIARPSLCIAVGLLMAAAPPIIGKLVPINLGPLDKLVEGERHLTLSGWDRTDYGILRQKNDAVLLQIANADVTDATIDLIADYKKLRELDVSHSQVTDQGLEKIARLATLEVLYLNNTQVTAAGVEEHLTEHPTLKVIWLRGTGITNESAEKVKAGKPGRRVHVGRLPPA